MIVYRSGLIAVRIEASYGRQHVHVVSVLTDPRFEKALIAHGIEDAGEQAFAGRVLQEAAPELVQEAVVKAGIDEVERRQVLPVDPGPDGLGGLAIAQAFTELHQCDECQTPGRVGGLATRWIEAGKRWVGEDRTKRFRSSR